MNEASSFCDGSYGTGTNLTNLRVPLILPGEPGNPVLGYPECSSQLGICLLPERRPVRSTLIKLWTVRKSLLMILHIHYREFCSCSLQLSQIPSVGAYACEFITSYNILLSPRRLGHLIDGNTEEELCNRWMQLAAFTPCFSQYDIEGAISQGPYR
ncbi:hypothetical protein IW262DRAFT_180184 [Armillaria fumosa]|nr:hypothetical protein IW262DRAFT_180184 [Armillaria fumosa]